MNAPNNSINTDGGKCTEALRDNVLGHRRTCTALCFHVDLILGKGLFRVSIDVGMYR